MKIWVVVASAARARVFERMGVKGPLTEKADLVNPQERLLRQDIDADRPGRATDRRGGQRHGVESKTDPKEQQARRFADDVVAMLEERRRGKSFELLYLVSSPHFLGLLRERMGRELAATIKAESAKDLTHEKADSLQQHLLALF
jgi:protein required for attachment to host cells